MGCTPMREFDSPAFGMACQQFDRVAHHLGLAQEVRERTK
jgi:hypothetical protein